MRVSGEPRYGQEIAREVIGLPFRGGRRVRYIWWMQVLTAALAAAAAWWVWRLAGGHWAQLTGPGGQPVPATAAAVTFATVVVVSALVESEARVTERRLERGRRDAEARERLGIPDGYVLAYELGGQPGQVGTDSVRGGECVVVGAVRADRWDLVEPLWRFTVRPAAAGGVVVLLGAGGLAGVSALAGFFTEVDAGRLHDLTQVERALIARGCRDLTSTVHQPPAH